jgi:hypothetical protein
MCGVAGEGGGGALNGDVDTDGNSLPVLLVLAVIYNQSLILVVNLPAVPVTPAVNVNLGKDVTTGVPVADLLVNDTGGQLATRVVDTSAVVHLDLQISLRIFKKIRNAAIGNMRGSREGDS